MRRFCKMAALCLAFIMAAVIVSGCDNKENYEEAIASVQAGCDKFLAVDAGNILVYKTVKTTLEIEGLVQDGSDETNIKFVKTADDYDFFLRRFVYTPNEETGESTLVSHHTFEKVGDTMVALDNGVGNVVDTAPDIFADVRLNFEITDLESAETKDLGKGEYEYKFVFAEDFVNGFDREENGGVFDCTKVVYTYYVDVMSNLSNITKEYTYTLTIDGEEQTVVEFFDIKTE